MPVLCFGSVNPAEHANEYWHAVHSSCYFVSLHPVQCTAAVILGLE